MAEASQQNQQQQHERLNNRRRDGNLLARVAYNYLMKAE
jgi:hypothetical protein